MTSVLLVVVAALGAMVALLFGAVVELYRQVLQVRQYAGLIDESRPLAFNSAVLLSALGFDLYSDRRDLQRTLLLILSDSCSTCFEIAASLASRPKDGVLVLVEARSPGEATTWLSLNGFVEGAAIKFDAGGRLAKEMGIQITPAAVRFEGQLPTSAVTVSSTGQLDQLLDWLAASPTPQVEELSA